MDAFLENKKYNLNSDIQNRVRRRQNFVLSFISSKAWERLVIYSFVVLLVRLIFDGIILGLHYFEYMDGFDFYIAEFKVFVFISIAISFILSFFIYQLYKAGKYHNKLVAVKILKNSYKTFQFLKYLMVFMVIGAFVSMILLIIEGSFIGTMFIVLIIAGLVVNYWFFKEILLINDKLSKLLLNRNVTLPKTANVRRSIKAVVIFNLVSLFSAVFILGLSIFTDFIDPGDLLFRISIYLIVPTMVFISFMVYLYSTMKEFSL